MPHRHKTPVTLVTGFLGAGKTSLLNATLLKAKAAGLTISVIENEFGEVNIDRELVQDQLLEKEDLVMLQNGCVCCSLRKDIVKAFAEIERRSRQRSRKVDAIVLEASGLTDPAPVAFTFFANPWIASRFRLDSIICVVDAQYLLQHLADARHEDGAVNEAVNQLAFADLILLNKVDLVSEQQLETVRAAILHINSNAQLRVVQLNSDAGQPPLSELLNTNLFSVGKALQADPGFLDSDTDDDDYDLDDPIITAPLPPSLILLQQQAAAAAAAQAAAAAERRAAARAARAAGSSPAGASASPSHAATPAAASGLCSAHAAAAATAAAAAAAWPATHTPGSSASAPAAQPTTSYAAPPFPAPGTAGAFAVHPSAHNTTVTVQPNQAALTAAMAAIPAASASAATAAATAPAASSPPAAAATASLPSPDPAEVAAAAAIGVPALQYPLPKPYPSLRPDMDAAQAMDARRQEAKSFRQQQRHAAAVAAMEAVHYDDTVMEVETPKEREPKRRCKRLHDLSDVSSVGIVAAGPLDEYLFNMFMRDLLAEKSKDILRCKGLLAMHGYGNQRFVFQGVHETITYGPADSPWGEDEPQVNSIVFIGRGLERKSLIESFRTCVWVPLPEGWSEFREPNTHRPYYVNRSTGVKTWVRPSAESHPVLLSSQSMVNQPPKRVRSRRPSSPFNSPTAAAASAAAGMGIEAA